MKEWFTAAELAGLKLPGLPTTKSGVLRFEGISSSRPRTGRGGGREYHLSALPESARVEIVRRAAEDQFQRGGAAQNSYTNDHTLGGIPTVLTPKQQQRADARLAVVRAADAFIANASLTRHSGTATFAHLWNAGKIPAEEWVRASVPSVHANSIHAWRARTTREGAAALAGRQGRHRLGAGRIDSTPVLRDFIVGLLAAKPHVDAGQIMRGLRARFSGGDLKLPSYRSLQRFLKTWKDANAGIFLAVTDPDAHRSRLGVAFGSASEATVALNQLWEWDATPADMLCVDGRHALVGVIDVWTRRAKIVVTPTSRSTAITAVLRKAALDWGLPGSIKGDNGKDFTSFHVLRAMADLNIKFVPCPPYTPEKKPHIERFFQTLSHQFIELLPGYAGHNVAERQAIRNRVSFADRRRRACARGAHDEDKPTAEIALSAAELQTKIDAWLETVYAHQHHGGIDTTPFAKAASWNGAVRRIVDPRALDVLLAEAPDNKGLRTVGKNGLRVEGAFFIAPELGAYVGDQVMVRFDAADLGLVYVFSARDGRFICEAQCAERLGADRETVAAQTKAVQKAMVAEGRKALAAVSRKAASEHVADDILAAGARNAAVIAAFPKPTVAHDTPALAEALKAVVTRGRSRLPRELDAREAAMHEKVIANLNGTAPKAAPQPTPESRFARARMIEAAGADTSSEDREWLEGYRQTSEYRAQKRLFLSFGERYAAVG